jgi:hypothetical protein
MQRPTSWMSFFVVSLAAGCPRGTVDGFTRSEATQWVAIHQRFRFATRVKHDSIDGVDAPSGLEGRTL